MKQPAIIPSPSTPSVRTPIEHHPRLGHSSILGIAAAALLSIGATFFFGLYGQEKAQAQTTPPAAAFPGEAQSASLPIEIDLAQSQYVTVVIEDSTGKRIRNLISETRLPAGKSTVYWDLYDDGRERNGDIIRKRVSAGTYTVRGLTHNGIKTIFEFPVYSGGNPPWATEDDTGAWLADHSSPLGATFIPSGSPYGDGKPQILLTALVAETGRPTVWVGTDGTTYKRTALWGWEGGEAAATDFGPNKDPRFYAYILCCFGESAPVKIMGLGTQGNGNPTIFEYATRVKPEKEPRELGWALSVRNGLAVFSVPLDDAVVVFDIKTGKKLETLSIKAPKGVLLTADGRLLISSDGKLVSYSIKRSNPDTIPTLTDMKVLVTGLEDPRTIQTDLAGKELYVADWGKSHQVKVFTADGTPVRTLGKPGGLQIGLYDEQRMHRPQGLAIDDRGQLWIAEADWFPKRISVWDTTTGNFSYARYGPPHYGGGGTIDSVDKNRLFYGEYGGTIEFKLDWEKGTSSVAAIPIRTTYDTPQLFDQMPGHTYGSFGPEVPHHFKGHIYLGLNYQSPLRSNENFAFWLLDEKTHTARPVAHVGSMRHWELVRSGPLLADIQKAGGIYEPLLCWTDLNADGKVTANEFQVRKSVETFTKADGTKQPLFGFRNMYPNEDMSLTGSWSVRIPSPKVRADGTLLYDISKATFLLKPTDENHWAEDGNPGILTKSNIYVQGFSGYKNGRQIWTYPTTNEIGLPPQYPGHVVEPTREMGPPFTPGQGEAQDVLCWNGERGNMYLITADGLFIQTIGGHRAVDPLMHFPKAERGMDVSGYSFEDEHFHPTITRTADGNVYMVAGKEHSSIFRLDGFETVKLQQFGNVQVTAAMIAKLPATLTIKGRKQARQELAVIAQPSAPVVDGNLDTDWANAQWVDIGNAGKGALAVQGDRLYAAYKTADPNVITNKAADLEFAFKRGGAVDLMVGPNERPSLDPRNGDLRLLVFQVDGKSQAVLYRQVSDAAPRGKSVLYESPIGKVQFADVQIISSQVTVAVSGGNVEFSVPLSALGLRGNPRDQFLGDMGILRGDGTQTVQRTYWNNLDTAMVSDIPTEARLSPGRWGQMTIKTQAQIAEDAAKQQK